MTRDLQQKAAVAALKQLPWRRLPDRQATEHKRPRAER
jgi:hypothetical protein